MKIEGFLQVYPEKTHEVSMMIDGINQLPAPLFLPSQDIKSDISPIFLVFWCEQIRDMFHDMYQALKWEYR